MFVPLVVWFSAQDSFTLEQVWYVSVVSRVLQSGISWWLLQRELSRKLQAPPPPAAESPVSEPA
jgi:hypothetical protein